MAQPKKTDCRINDGEEIKKASSQPPPKGEEFILFENIIIMNKLSKYTSIHSPLPWGGAGGRLWLSLELILVTIVCWWVLDPVLEKMYINNQPFGYDIDRMVRMEVASTLNRSERLEREDEISTEEEMLLRKVQDLDDVEVAFRSVYSAPGFDSYIGYSQTRDSAVLRFPTIYFQRESPMFEAYGIQSLTPEVPINELTNDCEENKSVILSRTLAMAAFGTTNVAGRTIKLYFVAENEWIEYRIRAVVEDAKQYWRDRDHTCCYICSKWKNTMNNLPIVVRLRDDISVEQFREKCEHELQQSLTTEHCYIRKIESAREKAESKYGQHDGPQVHRNMLTAAFFAINLSLGVLGTLIMYTRQRKEEAGVKRAFGATKWSVFWGFIREAWVLTTVSVFIGCIIYFQYLISGDFYEKGMYDNPIVHYWFDSIETHFPIVSLCVYLFILCTVLIGTAIPAWRICRSEITESLREQ